MLACRRDTLLEVCKAQGGESFAYFADILECTATATAKDLTPRAWKAARDQAAAAAGLA